MQKTLVIQDIDENFQKDNLTFFANDKVAKCVGCFHCWLKNPSVCRFNDGKEKLGSLLATSSDVYIYSKILYGGFSIQIKRLLDRCIPGILPFFKNRNGRQHHKPRYENKPNIHVVFYDIKNNSEEEIELAKNIANAMAINMNAKSCEVIFDEKTAEEMMEE